MTKRICISGIISLLLTAWAPETYAHPAHGIAIDKDNNVFFADVARTTIWRCSPDGKLTAHIPSTWTHTIRLQDDGTLYYERELDVDGVAPAELNRLDPDGHRRTVIRAERERKRFGGTGFIVLDDESVLFPYSDRGHDGKWRAFIGKRSKNGKTVVFAGSKTGRLFIDGPKQRATFRSITDMALGKNGEIYLLDRDRLRVITRDGRTRTIAANLLDQPPTDPPQKRGPPTTINRLYGLALGADGSFYIAYHSGRRVIRVSAGGDVETIYEVARPWAPVGVAVRRDKCVILETHDDLRKTGPRLRILEKGGPARTLVTVDRADR
ncbi:MAG: hypothetical protein MI923_07370 [Phycisphaerales bacterium]|nr:hypothetical protein [Phycisphaerales bacterium]